jgi:predicted methyltransferase
MKWDRGTCTCIPKSQFDVIKHDFNAEREELFAPHGKEISFLYLKDFLNYECELYMKQSSPLCKIMVAYHTYYKLPIENGRWLTIPISRDIMIMPIFLSKCS